MNEMKKLIDEKAKNENRIRQLQNRQKILQNRKIDAERKARTHRLVVHGAILEKVFPSAATMSDDELTVTLDRVFRNTTEA